MSGDGERDFDLCVRVNLYSCLNMLEGARSKLAVKAKFILTSAGATIGSDADTDYITKDDVISDASRATPHTTYGATKACCELLLSDYARRGFVDARALRLPTSCFQFPRQTRFETETDEPSCTFAAIPVSGPAVHARIKYASVHGRINHLVAI